jgi:hypothetical protein
MAFRIEKRCLAIVILAASLSAQSLTFSARKHTVTADDSGVTLDKRHWTYTDIRRLTLAPDKLVILTYDRRRDYAVSHLPDGAAAQLYPLLRAHMDQRLVPELPDLGGQALWQMPAKVERGWKGANGTLLVGADRIVFDTPARDASRTWRFTDIANISHSGLFDLSLTTRLGTEIRFALKEPLAEERFNALWLGLEEVNGLTPYQSRLGQHKEH